MWLARRLISVLECTYDFVLIRYGKLGPEPLLGFPQIGMVKQSRHTGTSLKLDSLNNFRQALGYRNGSVSSGSGVISVQLLSHVQLLVTPWTAASQASLSITNSPSLLKLMSIKLVMPSNYLILCSPLLLLPSIFSSIRVFLNESVLQVAKVLEFQLQHQSFQWIFRVDFL